MSQFLITVDDALRALAEARNPEQSIELANPAETLRRYAQRARLGMAAQNRFAFARKESLRIRHAIRVAVQNLFRCGTATISASPGNSHRAQRLAAIPAKDFDWYLVTAAAQEWETHHAAVAALF